MKLRNLKMELPYVHPKNNKLHDFHADSELSIVVRVSDELRIMKILAQALVLALLIMLLPGFSESLSSNYDNVLTSKNTILTDHHQISALNLKSIPLVLDDLANQGLLTTKEKSLIVSNNILNVHNNKIKDTVISPTDTKRQSSVSDDTFDIIFTNCFQVARGFIDRTLKVDGIMVVHLSKDPSLAFVVPSNYKMVYFRRLDDTTFIAMRKMISSNDRTTRTPKSPTQRKLFEFFSSEEKKAVLKNLEDVLLEPPRSASGKSRTYLRKTKFLPDLLNDSLEGYSRRVYLDVGGGPGSTRWFEQNYPTRNKDFDMYRIETVPETETEVETDDVAWEGPPTQMGISDWLWRNVKEEEYVVMKAEAEVVEEMLKSKAILLVDELFLECKPRGKGGKSNRAYWECLALYGRLRDFGVAVHQWWG